MAENEYAYAQIESLFALVERDKGLKASVRQRVTRLRPLLSTNPDLAYERLCEVCAAVANNLPRVKPTHTLARFVSVEVYYLYHLSSDFRAFFLTAESYRRFLDGEPNPDAVLTAQLSPDDPVFPARHSWLVPANQTAHLDGKETIRLLQLRGEPPLVRFNLPLKNLLANRTTVRSPSAVDAVCEGFFQWSPLGPSSEIAELIDSDVPRAAVNKAELRR